MNSSKQNYSMYTTIPAPNLVSTEQKKLFTTITEGRNFMTMTKKLIERFGEEKLYEIWCENNGMYKAAEYITKQTENIVPRM